MKKKTTPEEILAPHGPEVRALVERLRALVRSEVPAVEERAYPGWKAIGYRDEQSGYFCGIFPYADRVRLMFEHGVALDDPAGVLEGDGKQVRHVEMRPGERIPERAIRGLIGDALRFGAVR
jgi:hypothetical protein